MISPLNSIVEEQLKSNEFSLNVVALSLQEDVLEKINHILRGDVIRLKISKVNLPASNIVSSGFDFLPTFPLAGLVGVLSNSKILNSYGLHNFGNRMTTVE